MSAGRGEAGEIPPPFSSRVCDLVVAGFALWTVCAHVAVGAGAGLDALITGFAIAAAVAGFGLARFWNPASQALPTAEAPAERTRRGWIVQGVGGALGLALAGAAIAGSDAIPLWWSVVGLLGGAAVCFLVLEAPVTAAPLRGRWPEVALWCLAGCCVVVAITVHRPDIDDSFYVNVAVAAADFPGQPLLASDTLLGHDDLPLHMPAHRVHSYELWNGAVSRLTGIPAIYAFHWLSAGLFAALLPLAHARIFRLLTPRIWPWAVAGLIFVLLAVGETHRWYGNFALVRIWQGKAVFLCFFLPLVYAYAIEFALRPSSTRWGLLLAAQTAAVGCSSSAIWAAPVGALTALCCVVRPTAVGLRRLAVGALASTYAVGVGFVLKGDVQGLIEPMLREHAFGEQLASALRATLGGAAVQSFGVFAVLVAWSLCARGLAQRFAIALPLAVWLVLLNPYLDGWVSANVTGPSYWRVMWSLPVPILMTLVLIAPLQLGRGVGARLAGGAASLALFAVFASTVPEFDAFDERNAGAAGVGIRVGLPGPKAPGSAYRWAAALNAAVPPGSQVVAPPEVSAWIPTFHHHAYPLQARRLYLTNHIPRLGEDDVKLRIFMTRYVGGQRDVDNARGFFVYGLDYFDVKAVLLRNSGYAVEVRSALEEGGFERTTRAIDHEIWLRR